MTNNSISKKRVDSVFSALQEKAKTASVRTKLARIHNACQKISENTVVSVANVVRYIAEEGVKLSKRTIYNDREGGNPYKELIEEWMKHSELVHSEKKSRVKNVDTETALSLVDEEDLAKIPDIALRHKFSLMYGELRSLRNQVTILKDVKALPSISQSQIAYEANNDDLLTYQGNNKELSDYEREVIKDFLSAKLAPLAFDEDGALVSKSVIKRDETLSGEGLKEILEKLIQ